MDKQMRLNVIAATLIVLLSACGKSPEEKAAELAAAGGPHYLSAPA